MIRHYLRIAADLLNQMQRTFRYIFIHGCGQQAAVQQPVHFNGAQRLQLAPRLLSSSLALKGCLNFNLDSLLLLLRAHRLQQHAALLCGLLRLQALRKTQHPRFFRQASYQSFVFPMLF